MFPTLSFEIVQHSEDSRTEFSKYTVPSGLIVFSFRYIMLRKIRDLWN